MFKGGGKIEGEEQKQAEEYIQRRKELYQTQEGDHYDLITEKRDTEDGKTTYNLQNKKWHAINQKKAKIRNDKKQKTLKYIIEYGKHNGLRNGERFLTIEEIQALTGRKTPQGARGIMEETAYYYPDVCYVKPYIYGKKKRIVLIFYLEE